jgi:flagellar hook-associated protein 2
MGTISFSGFNNIDFSSVVDALMNVEKLPLTQLQTQQTNASAQQSAYATLATKLSAVRSASGALMSATAFNGTAATLSNSSALSVTLGAGTPVGSYEVYINSLARAQVTTTSSTHADKDTTIVASGGTLTIGGTTVTLTGDVTLDGLASAINGTSDIGVTAAVVRNGANYQLVLTGKNTGADNAFAITNNLTGGTGAAFSGTNAQNASDAAGTVNGVAFTSSTNELTGAIPGSTLKLMQVASTTPVTVAVTPDNTDLKAKLNTFVTAYNDMLTFLDQQDQAAAAKDPGSISRDSLTKSLRRQLNSLVSKTFGTGTFTSLPEVGFTFARNGQMQFDSKMFDTAMTADADSVKALFTGAGATTGAFKAFDEAVKTYTQSGGLVPNAQNRLSTQLTNLAKRIEDMNARLAVRKKALQAQFTAADAAISQLNSLTGTLSNLQNSLF